MKKLTLLSVVSLAMPGILMAAAYKIPEQSIRSTALSAAYVANAHGADAAYYNPAAMMFNENRPMLEADLSYIRITSIKGDGIFGGAIPYSDSTKGEDVVIPTLHYVSPLVGKMRFGLSLIAPAGLSMRWNGFAKYASEEFTLETYEINPSMAFKLSDRVAIAGGVRAIYSKGIVKSSSATNPAVPIGRDMKGDSFDYGYNLALLFRPTDELSLAATYRSKIKLTEEGTASLTVPAAPAFNYSGYAAVDVPVPAALNLAIAYTFNHKSTVELLYERTYWSAYKSLDFNYAVSFTGAHPLAAFDTPATKDWEDSDTFRIGLTHQLSSQWTLMAGFAWDETPIPKRTVGFELPDSDARIYSVGAIYQYSDRLSIGGALLYDDKEKLTISASDANINGLVGGFREASVYFGTVGLEYKF